MDGRWRVGRLTEDQAHILFDGTFATAATGHCKTDRTCRAERSKLKALPFALRLARLDAFQTSKRSGTQSATALCKVIQ
jgi:hypothetical protein